MNRALIRHSCFPSPSSSSWVGSHFASAFVPGRSRTQDWMELSVQASNPNASASWQGGDGVHTPVSTAAAAGLAALGSLAGGCDCADTRDGQAWFWPLGTCFLDVMISNIFSWGLYILFSQATIYINPIRSKDCCVSIQVLLPDAVE